MQPIVFIHKLASFFRRVLDRPDIYKEYADLNLALIDPEEDGEDELLSDDGELLRAVFEDPEFPKPTVFLAEQTTPSPQFPFITIRKSHQGRTTIFPERYLFNDNKKKTVHNINFGVTVTAYNKNTQNSDLSYGISEMYLSVLLNHFLADGMNFCDNQVGFTRVSRYPLNVPVSVDAEFQDVCVLELDFRTNTVLEETMTEAKYLEVNLEERDANIVENIDTEVVGWDN